MSPRPARRRPETVSVDEGACGQLVPSAAGRRTVPSEPGEPSRAGWASASARFLLGKEPRCPSWTRGALGVRAGDDLYFGCRRAAADQLPRPWRPSLQAPGRMR